MTSVSAVLFAKDLQRVSDFYVEALGLQRSAADDHHVALDCRGFSLIVHQIPQALIHESEPLFPRREEASLRLTFPVNDIATARQRAATYGGHIDPTPPAWAEANAFLGHDPEGNVFKIVHAPRG